MADAMQTCPRCDGTGKTHGSANTTVGCYWGPIPCSLCKGWGEISAELVERRAEGERIRAARDAADVSQREAAAARGMKVTEYSQLEAPTSDREWNPDAARELAEFLERKENERG